MADKPTAEMSCNEFVAWARRYLLLEISADNYSNGVWMVVDRAFRRGRIAATEEINATNATPGTT